MSDWDKAAERALKAHAVLLIGLPDTGKSTFFEDLRGHARERGSAAGFIDADLGQKSIGPPCTVGLDIPFLNTSSIHFVGDTTPAVSALEAVVGVEHLEREARRLGCSTVVVDTSGLAGGPLGARLKGAKAEVIEADLALIFERGDELRGLADLLSSRGMRVERLPVRREVRQVSPAERAENRRLRYVDYFLNAVVHTLSRSRTAVFPSDHEEWPAGLLLGVFDSGWSTLAMGALVGTTEGEVVLRSPAFDLEKARLIKPGRVGIDEQGREARPGR
ncbi:MAG: Clp1/GlmU family protein [Candidatus Aquicultorales bacterium]